MSIRAGYRQVVRVDVRDDRLAYEGVHLLFAIVGIRALRVRVWPAAGPDEYDDHRRHDTPADQGIQGDLDVRRRIPESETHRRLIENGVPPTAVGLVAGRRVDVFGYGLDPRPGSGQLGGRHGSAPGWPP